MTKKTFISYRYKDKKEVHNIDNFTQSNDGKIPGELVRVKQAKEQKDAATIDKEIKNGMKDCDAVLFVVGDNNHNSPWVKREVELAISKDLHKVVTRLPKTTGGLPPALKKSKHEEAKFNPMDIGKKLSNEKFKKN